MEVERAEKQAAASVVEMGSEMVAVVVAKGVMKEDPAARVDKQEEKQATGVRAAAERGGVAVANEVVATEGVVEEALQAVPAEPRAGSH